MAGRPSVSFRVRAGLKGVPGINLNVDGALDAPNLYPVIGLKTTTSASTTNNSPVITVASATGISNGDSVFGAGIPGSARVLSGSGTTTLTLSASATATQAAVALTFGIDRYDNTNRVRTNTVAAKNGYFGKASQGRSTWLNQVGAVGYDYPDVSALTSLAIGSVGATFGARMSDMNTGLNSILGEVVVTLTDVNPNGYSSWGQYVQHIAAPSTVGGGHLGLESSILSYWPTVDIDPFAFNEHGSIRNARYDCGLGYSVAGYDPYPGFTPQNIGAFIDFVYNDARARAGIVVGFDSLDTSGGRVAPAVAMPPNVGLSWYKGAGSRSWDIVCPVATGYSRLTLLDGEARFATQIVGIDGASGSAKSTVYRTAGLSRWQTGATSAAESGSNAGSDYVVARFDDAGAFVDIPLSINRSTGITSVLGIAFNSLPGSYATDAAAGAAGLATNRIYRDGTVLMVRDGAASEGSVTYTPTVAGMTMTSISARYKRIPGTRLVTVFVLGQVNAITSGAVKISAPLTPASGRYPIGQCLNQSTLALVGVSIDDDVNMHFTGNGGGAPFVGGAFFAAEITYET